MKIAQSTPVGIFLHENVLGFPDLEMERVLGRYQTGFLVELPSSVQLPMTGGDYTVHTFELNPELFGFPTRRKRKYSFCFKKNMVESLDLQVDDVLFL